MPRISLFLTCSFALLSAVYGHSLLTQPLPMSPFYCALADDEGNCKGPCQTSIEGFEEWQYGNPDRPTFTYKRGTEYKFKYLRNNHRAGGFVRLSLVNLEDIMSLNVHKRNAFHFSCFGAQVQVPSKSEISSYPGDTLIGVDGEEHNQTPAYYVMKATIPEVIPDGTYVLGWSWYGGTVGKVTSNKPQKPAVEGEAIDYWSCAFVRVQGGPGPKQKQSKVFKNDMSQFSDKGCRAISDKPGECGTEAQGCPGTFARYRLSEEFLGDANPEIMQSYYN